MNDQFDMAVTGNVRLKLELGSSYLHSTDRYQASNMLWDMGGMMPPETMLVQLAKS